MVIAVLVSTTALVSVAVVSDVGSGLGLGTDLTSGCTGITSFTSGTEGSLLVDLTLEIQQNKDTVKQESN